MVIGIEGYVGAGKTSICRELLNIIPLVIIKIVIDSTKSNKVVSINRDKNEKQQEPQKPLAQEIEVEAVDPSTVKFVDFDGSTIKEQKVAYGESATAPEDPVRRGYTFVSWQNIDKIDNVVEDITVTATYKINTYSVKSFPLEICCLCSLTTTFSLKIVLLFHY